MRLPLGRLMVSAAGLVGILLAGISEHIRLGAQDSCRKDVLDEVTVVGRRKRGTYMNKRGKKGTCQHGEHEDRFHLRGDGRLTR